MSKRENQKFRRKCNQAYKVAAEDLQFQLFSSASPSSVSLDVSNPHDPSHVEREIPDQLSRTVSSCNIEVQSENNPYSSQENIELRKNQEYVNRREALAEWAILNNIPHTAINSLLYILNSTSVFKLPADARTLLKTSREDHVENVENGQFWYGGIEENLKLIIRRDQTLKDLHLLINIDGLPLYKSSNIQLWPILIAVKNSVHKDPFIVALWCGEGKPNLNIFVENFVIELSTLISNGIYFLNNHEIKTVVFVCDAPARAFIKGIKTHSGYYSCEKCIQKGVYYKSVVFPEINSKLRTNDGFRQRIYKEHHLTDSPLELLPIDMINSFGLDYMHLVCLGVVRKLISMWLSEVPHKLSVQQISKISNRIDHVRQYVPIDFNRKLRNFNYFRVWKATEYRMFLLYYGPIVLKNVLDAEKYEHFILLHCAIRILNCKYRMHKYSYIARFLLKEFVSSFKNIYGSKHIVYNVHNLLHLANDCCNLGTLDSWSAFPFENYLGKIKNFVRSGRKPLNQIVNRLKEYQLIIKLEANKSKQCKYPCIDNIVIKNRFPNNFVTLHDGNVIKIVKIENNNEDFLLYGYKFRKKDDYFREPFLSCKIGIVKVAKLFTDQLIPVYLNQIRNKLFVIPLNNNIFLCFPM